jgi:hypothetical protein
MSNCFDASEVASLAAALPGRLHAATQTMLLAERRLAHALLMRDTGRPMKASELGVARMALARTQRDLEDLKRIQGLLPGLLEQSRESCHTENMADVVA